MMKIKDAEIASGETWQSILQKEFPFMQQDSKDAHNIYKTWGFECSGGWYPLLRECCEAIVTRYAEDGIGLEGIDFVPEQIKEKFGGLRFYYSYTDAPCKIAAFDNLATGETLRFQSKSGGKVEDAKAKLRHDDIRMIVRSAERKSKCTCEVCGADGELRNDSEIGIYWVQTLCDTCHANRIKKMMDAKSRY